MERQSNFELLRIIAMFLVLAVHANYFALDGGPSAQECATRVIPSMTRIVLESACIVCVDVFVLISGWFGIHFKWKSLLSFLFQVFFFGLLIYAFCVIFLDFPLNIKGIAACFQITTWNWFVKSYLLLYLMSPILNAFCDQSDKKAFLLVLISFFSFQTIYGLTGSARFIEQGYSTISFIGLYLLAQYIRKFATFFSEKSIQFHCMGYFLCVTMLSILEFISRLTNHPTRQIFSYINPIVILASVFLLLFFSKLRFTNRLVNQIASSCFAVFLLHTNVNLCEPVFCKKIVALYNLNDGIVCLFLICCFLSVCYLLAILIDRFRKVIWLLLTKYFN